MRFFRAGVSRCSLCDGILTADDDLFTTWGVFATDPELFLHCEALMHWSCYAAWPRREAFARAYFEFWIEEERGNRHWARAYLDDRALMTVNPFNRANGEARLLLARTGYEIRIDLAGWERWLEAPETTEGHELHPLVVEELRDVVSSIRAAMPTADAVMDALDGESKGWTRKSADGG